MFVTDKNHDDIDVNYLINTYRRKHVNSISEKLFLFIIEKHKNNNNKI